MREAKKDEPGVVEVKIPRYSYGNERDLENKGGFYVRCEKENPDAVPFVATGAQGGGERGFMKMTRKKDPETGRETQKKRTIGDARGELSTRRTRLAIEDASRIIRKLEWISDMIEKGWDRDKLLRLVVYRCSIEPTVKDVDYSWPAGRLNDRMESIDALDADGLDEEIWLSVRGLVVSNNYRQSEAKAIIELLGVEWEPLWKKAKETHPEPKEWKGLKSLDAIPEGTDPRAISGPLHLE